MPAPSISYLKSTLILLTLAALVAPELPAALNGALTILWDANKSDPDLAGYRVFLADDPAVFSLSPADASAQALTKAVPLTTTQYTFSGLDSATVYWAAVTAYDKSGNESPFSAVISGQPPDTTPPSVSLVSPVSGATVTGVTKLEAAATDDRWVAGVFFLLDGAVLGPEDVSAPYSFIWDPVQVPAGAHALRAAARDGSGNRALSAAVTVTVSHPVTLDSDWDGVPDASDNCPMVSNKEQMNTDGDNEGGDACDITVIAPRAGPFLCSGPAPLVKWTREVYDGFRVALSVSPGFTERTTSGLALLPTTSWQVPDSSWMTLCGKGSTQVYVRVVGRSASLGVAEFSEVVALTVR